MDLLLYSDVQHAWQFSIIVISCPGYIIIAGISSCLLDHVWNDFYLVDSHDFFDCSWVHIYLWRGDSILASPVPVIGTFKLFN